MTKRKDSSFNMSAITDVNETITTYRHCLWNSQLETRTNYSACSEKNHTTSTNETDGSLSDEGIGEYHLQIIVGIMFCCSTVSVVVLVISLCVFNRFKSLKCARTRIHSNLIVSFIFRFVVNILHLEPMVLQHEDFIFTEKVLCRTLVTIEQFGYMTNFSWMLVEGLYLHIIIVLKPLNQEKVPFMIFYFMGWVFPLMVAVSWAFVMHYKREAMCWNEEPLQPYIYIIYIPIMLALFINFLILINLVRIIIIKVCAGQSSEKRKIWRTIRSTVILIFLLGIINLVFMTTGNGGVNVIIAYLYVYSILPSMQGIFIALIYCGMNSEVRKAICKRWRRYKNSRILTNSTYRGRNSRTSVTIFNSRNQQFNNAEPLQMEALNDQNLQQRI